MVVQIAKRYQRHGLDFCIITFYDPQRAAIAKALKAVDLPTGCVYNVDSFQGIDHPSSNGDALISTVAGTVRKRIRLCDLVFSQDRTSRILELTTPHERRPDSLPQRNGSRHQQVFPATDGDGYAPGAAPLRLVTASQYLDRLAGHAKQSRRASRTPRASTAVKRPQSSLGRTSISTLTCNRIPTTTTSPLHQYRRTIAPQPAPTNHDTTMQSDDDGTAAAAASTADRRNVPALIISSWDERSRDATTRPARSVGEA